MNSNPVELENFANGLMMETDDGEGARNQKSRVTCKQMRLIFETSPPKHYIYSGLEENTYNVNL